MRYGCTVERQDAPSDDLVFQEFYQHLGNSMSLCLRHHVDADLPHDRTVGTGSSHSKDLPVPECPYAQHIRCLLAKTISFFKTLISTELPDILSFIPPDLIVTGIDIRNLHSLNHSVSITVSGPAVIVKYTWIYLDLFCGQIYFISDA